MEKQPRYWHGKAPKTCELTSAPITNVFIDGKTRRGPWRIMCPEAWTKYGITADGSFGTGIGQRYEKQPDGKWLKTAG